MKVSKKIFSLVLGTSMFFTGMPECFAMMESAGQDPTQPLSTDAPSEEAADGSSGLGSPAPAPAPAPSDSPDMTDVDLFGLFDDVPTSNETSSTFGTTVPLPSEGAVQLRTVEDVAAAGSAAHAAEPEERHDVPLSDETLRRSALPDTLSGEGERSSDEESGDDSDSSSAASSGSVSPDISSDEGETSEGEVAPQPQVSQEGENLADSLDVGPAADAGTALSRSSSRSSDSGETSDDESESEREEEAVALPAQPFQLEPGIIAEPVRIPVPGTEKPSFFAKTVDVAVVAHPSLSRDVVTNFISRVWNPTAGKCKVNGTKRKVKFDLIGSDNLNSLKNYRVIIYPFNSESDDWRSAEHDFLMDMEPINSRASVVFVSVNSEPLLQADVQDMLNIGMRTAGRRVTYATDEDENMDPDFGFLPFIVRHFDEADPNFSSWTPSQRTGVKRGGIAAACVGGAWIAYKKISSKFKKPNQKKLKKQHKEDKKSEQNQIANV